MIALDILRALHLLGVVAWVGGMAFALLVLRPSLTVLEPPQRLALNVPVFRRFFRIIWHAMPIVVASGYAMLFLAFGGFARAPWPVHVMHLLGLVMAAVFLLIFFRPWPALRAAQIAGNRTAAAAALETIRRLVMVNLGLGVVVVVLGALV